MSILKASANKHIQQWQSTRLVVAAQEFANASSAKCGFTSPILQPTVETHHIHHIIVTSLQVGMADAKLTFRHGVEIPKRRCFETLLRSVIQNTHVTWLRRFEASGRVTSVSRRGILADSAFDWQGRKQITQLHICLNLTPTKYKSGVNASSLRGFLWGERFAIVIFIV